MMQECASEFVSFIVSEAAESAANAKSKMVTADDVLTALHNLGFEGYVEPLTRFVENYRKVSGLFFLTIIVISLTRQPADSSGREIARASA